MAHLQIKNLPEDMHEELRRRAADRSESVRDYVLDLIRRDLSLPTFEDWIEEIHANPPAPSDVDSPRIIREGRVERETALTDRLR